jgi:hypothetical protein
MHKSIKNIALAAVALGAFSLTACMSSGSSAVGPRSDEFGTVVIQANTKNLNSLSKPGLGKASIIELDSLIITAISNAVVPDTVVVRLAVGDSGFVATSTITQNINVTLSLKALRSWTISARTVDGNDSTIHTGTTNVNNLLAGQVRVVNLSANPLFVMYKAKFNFPDSIFSPTGLFGQKISLSKIVLIVDGAGLDSLSGSLADSTDYEVAYDYVALDADSVSLKVYGTLEGASAPWNTQSLLYTKTVAIANLTVNSVNPVTLNWVGPPGGVANLQVEIGRVGLYEIDGVTPPIVLD